MDLANRRDRLTIIRKALKHLVGYGDVSTEGNEGALGAVLCRHIYGSQDTPPLVGFMERENQAKLFNEYENAILDILEVINRYEPRD